MVLEAVVYPQDPFSYGGKDLYNFNYNYNYSYNLLQPTQPYQDEHHASASLDFLENQTENNWDCSPPSMLLPHLNEVHQYAISNSNPCSASASASASAETNNACSSNNSIPRSEGHNLDNSIAMTVARPKRRRAKTRKNKEEIENQRMTHIAVERNRRKQMNEYLSVLRSLMPDSYVQRGDQASIIGGAINFVKELEQRLQFLGTHKQTEGKWKSENNGGGNLPFSEFFTFPQYSSHCRTPMLGEGEGVSEAECGSGIADIEVTMVESHANLKIRSKKRPKQLLKMVSALHTMRLTILHLNVTTTAEIVLYSLSVKVEEDCKLGSVDDIAAALFQMMDTIHQEAMLLN